jgi:hypothetical protein
MQTIACSPACLHVCLRLAVTSCLASPHCNPATAGPLQVFGSAFVHGGEPGSGPVPYVDPDLLLAQPTLDPTVPFNAYPDSFNY